MIKVYLAGPINGCTDEECVNWRQFVKDNWDCKPIDPMVRDYRGKETNDYREIVDLDKRDIRESDLILVNYVKPSVGTSMEIHYAWTIGKPIVVVAPINARISPWLRYHSTAIVHTFKEAQEKFNFYFQK